METRASQIDSAASGLRSPASARSIQYNQDRITGTRRGFLEQTQLARRAVRMTRPDYCH